MQKIVFGAAAALGVAVVLLSQGGVAATPAKPHASQNVTAAAAKPSVIPGSLRAHMAEGTKVYLGDVAIASIDKIDDTMGNIVIAPVAAANAPKPMKRVVASSAFSFADGKLAINMTNAQINALPTY